MSETILIKWGGSLITDKTTPYMERKDVIDRLSSELRDFMDQKPDTQLVVGHGGGSYPHQSASKYQTHKGIINEKSYEGIAKVQQDASRLNRIVIDSLIENGVPAMSVQPSASCVANDGEIHWWDLKAVREALDKNMIPVPYGDVALDIAKGCCILSTEKLLSHIASDLDPDRLILCGNTEGVFTGDPAENEDAELIEKITPQNFSEVKEYLTGSQGKDVTGGMLHKVEMCLELASGGVDCELINGERKDILKKSLLGEDVVGTLITDPDKGGD